MTDFLLADGISFTYFWPQQLLAWFLWGFLFAGIGASVAWRRWHKLKASADEVESDLKRLRLEQTRLRGLLRDHQITK
tara:strand:+ start:12912 stop:13145 length:234 start_codon:yes stop_codon:yes gene_type:complete